jgi:hypothetical protein
MTTFITYHTVQQLPMTTVITYHTVKESHTTTVLNCMVGNKCSHS